MSAPKPERSGSDTVKYSIQCTDDREDECSNNTRSQISNNSLQNNDSLLQSLPQDENSFSNNGSYNWRGEQHQSQQSHIQYEKLFDGGLYDYANGHPFDRPTAFYPQKYRGANNIFSDVDRYSSPNDRYHTNSHRYNTSAERPYDRLDSSSDPNNAFSEYPTNIHENVYSSIPPFRSHETFAPQSNNISKPLPSQLSRLSSQEPRNYTYNERLNVDIHSEIPSPNTSANYVSGSLFSNQDVNPPWLPKHTETVSKPDDRHASTKDYNGSPYNSKGNNYAQNDPIRDRAYNTLNDVNDVSSNTHSDTHSIHYNIQRVNSIDENVWPAANADDLSCHSSSRQQQSEKELYAQNEHRDSKECSYAYSLTGWNENDHNNTDISHFSKNEKSNNHCQNNKTVTHINTPSSAISQQKQEHSSSSYRHERKDEIIESGESDSASSQDSDSTDDEYSNRCIGPVCFHRGKQNRGNLCQNCFDILSRYNSRNSLDAGSHLSLTPNYCKGPSCRNSGNKSMKGLCMSCFKILSEFRAAENKGKLQAYTPKPEEIAGQYRTSTDISWDLYYKTQLPEKRYLNPREPTSSNVKRTRSSSQTRKQNNSNRPIMAAKLPQELQTERVSSLREQSKKCRSPGCANYGNARCHGYCNQCFNFLPK